MAYDIGPRIGIEGEAEFRKTINQIISTQRTLATEMDAVSSAFDKNDHSQEALTAQNEVLNKQLDVQRQKLAALQQGLEAAAERYGENDRVTQGWQQAVNRATADLNRMERQLGENNAALGGADAEMTDAANAAGNLGDSMDNAGDSASIFGDVLGAELVANGLEKVTESATEAAKSVLDFAMSSDASIGMLQARLGLTKDEATDLSVVAKAIWTDGFGEDLNEATESVTVIRQLLGNMAKDEMERVAGAALTISQVFGADVSESVRTAKTMMDNFKISATEAFDLITVGYQNGLDYSGEFLDTLNEYSPQFKSMGFSADEAMQLLIQGSDNGAFSLDKVADAMKEFNIRIKDGSDTTREGLQMIGLDYDAIIKQINDGSLSTGDAMQLIIEKLKEQDNTINRNTAGVDLFGTQWEDLGADAVLSMGGITSSLSDVEGATKKAGDAAGDNLKNKFDTAIRGIQASLEPIAHQILDFANNIMPQIQKAMEWIGSNAPSIAVAIGGIGTAFLTWKVSSMILGLVLAIQTLSGGLATATTAQLALNAATVANPVGAIITAIIVATTLLVAGIMTLWNTNEGFRNALIGAWEAIKTAGEAVWGWLVKFFTEDIPAAISSAIEWVVQLPGRISEFFSQIPGIVSSAFGEAVSKVSEFGSNIINWAKTEIPKFVQGIMTFIDELPGKIGYALGFALGTIVQFGVDAIKWVIGEIPKIIDGIITFFSELPGKTKEQLTNALNTISQWGTDIVNWVATNVPVLIGNIVTFFSQLPGKIQIQLSSVLANLGTWARNMLTTAKTEVPKITSSIISFFAELPGKMLDIGGNLVKGLWDGIKNSASWLLNKIKDFADNIIQGFKDAFDVKSPSRIMRDEVGMMIGAGMAVGIDDSISEVKAAMARLNQNIIADADISKGTNVARGSSPVNSGGALDSGSGGLSVIIENFINNRAQDVQAFAEELEFYRKQASAARGGG